MAAFLFVGLFFLGILLSIVGQVISLVTAFQESSTWGVMALLVPFASLVFLVKFWDRLWVRRSLWVSLIGAVMMILGIVGMIKTTPMEGDRQGTFDSSTVDPESSR
jgi:uncharacterized membrane protein